MPKWNKVCQAAAAAGCEDLENDAAAAAAAASAQSREPEAPAPRPRSSARTVELVVRHWVHGGEMRVRLPKGAKFKHLKRAMAKRLGEGRPPSDLRLMSKQGGVYRAYRDSQPIGDTRLVLARCQEDLLPEGGAAAAAVSEGEVSAEEVPEVPARAEVSAASDGRILSDAAAMSTAARRVREGFPLTRRQAISLQLELLEAFRTDVFQRRLQALQADREAGVLSQVEFLRMQGDLRLQEQTRVIPKYGFEASVEGRDKMIASFDALLADPEIAENMQESFRLLGQSGVSDERWRTASSQLRQLQDGPRHRAQRRLPPASGLLLMGSAGRGAGLRMTHTAALASLVLEEDGDSGSDAADLEFEPWPPGRQQPYGLYVVGSWNDNVPEPMSWESGVYICTVTLGPEGLEVFQLIVGRDWSRAFYPSVQDATMQTEHSVLGPDDRSEGRSWLMGSADGSTGQPGDMFDVVAVMDSDARVRSVHWRLVLS